MCMCVCVCVCVCDSTAHPHGMGNGLEKVPKTLPAPLYPGWLTAVSGDPTNAVETKERKQRLCR